MARKKSDEPKKKRDPNPTRAKPLNTLRHAGRVLLLNEQFIEKAKALLIQGNFEQTVAGALGVTVSCWIMWKRRGNAEIQRRLDGFPPDEKEEIFVKFFEAIQRSAALSEMSLLRDMKRVGANQWTMYATILERRFASRWGRRNIPAEGIGEDDGSTPAKQENTVVIMELPDNGRD